MEYHVVLSVIQGRKSLPSQEEILKYVNGYRELSPAKLAELENVVRNFVPFRERENLGPSEARKIDAADRISRDAVCIAVRDLADLFRSDTFGGQEPVAINYTARKIAAVTAFDTTTPPQESVEILRKWKNPILNFAMIEMGYDQPCKGLYSTPIGKLQLYEAHLSSREPVCVQNQKLAEYLLK